MTTSKTLCLTVHKKWFDMIVSGEKKEEYRSLSPHWASRLCKLQHFQYIEGMEDCLSDKFSPVIFKQYDIVYFFNGGYFSEKLPFCRVKLEGISIGLPKPEWTEEPTQKLLFCTWVKLFKTFRL